MLVQRDSRCTFYTLINSAQYYLLSIFQDRRFS
nr:MAG TPA: hypothetical protein [Ackermannviridae sp.]